MHVSKDKKYSVVPKKVSYQCFFQDLWMDFLKGKGWVRIGGKHEVVANVDSRLILLVAVIKKALGSVFYGIRGRN
jgi:hypothetical protein